MNEELKEKLFEAIKYNPNDNRTEAERLKVVEDLFKDGNADPNAAYIDGWTVLMEASHEGHASIVNFLLEKGADPNFAKKYGWTALMSAANNGHSEVVKLLLEKKANPHASLKADWTALYAASEEWANAKGQKSEEYRQIIEDLRNKGAK